ncbi:Membrane protein PM19L [Linum grandiflorum]
MASGASRSASLLLLILNILLYFIIVVVASWAVNHAILRSHEAASVLSIPARIFPIFFPMGNMATGVFVIISLLAGIVGIATSFVGIQNVLVSNAANLHAAASSSLASLALTLLAMGLACKEIDIGWTDANLRTLEVVTIIVSATQLLCTGALHAGVEEVEARRRILG